MSFDNTRLIEKKSIFRKKKLIEEKFRAQDLENMEKFDRKEKAKKDLLNKKKNEQTKMIKEQREEAKIKRLKEFQEKAIEGFMARQDYLDGVKEDELKAEQEKQRKNKLREEFIQGNEEAKLRKKNRMLKEIEDEKKREEFRLEKDRLEEIKKKKDEASFGFVAIDSKKKDVKVFLSDEDITTKGDMPPEFIGRVLIVNLNKLTKEEFLLFREKYLKRFT